MRKITGHLTSKGGKYYAVINLYDTEGNRKVKWQNLDLPDAKGNKRKAQERLTEVLAKYNSGDLYLAESMTPAERERNRIADSLVEDYLLEWIEAHKINIEENTYEHYKSYITGRIIPFLEPMKIKVKEITGDEINALYQHLLNDGLSGTSVQRYHGVLHKAFKDAVKRRIIPANPVDQATRPKREQFIADYYNGEEIKKLLEVAKNDEIYIPILLTAYYGLRRSEVLGIKWSAIDFTENMITIRHTVHSGKDGPIGKDRLKTKSSYRTLPLLPMIRDELLKHQQAHTELRRVMRKAYTTEYSEYVCVDALGQLYDPDFITTHFSIVLKRNNLKKIRFHDLRHSCASLLVAQGVSMKLIQEWLGHSDMNTTANIYSHVDSVSKMETGNVIGEVLGGK